jgi:hypothetical protein
MPKSPAEEAERGEHLLFLISQPRSGSTLLQHILASHPDIHTLPEPWMMLHLVYALHEHGITAEYNAHYAYLALQGFLSKTGGEEIYMRALRDMALQLYRAALEGTGKRIFLDKTPRYYLIIPDLYHLFPAARFVLLVRNPLAVFASILNVSLGGDLRGMLGEDRRHDVITAPDRILHAMDLLNQKALVVRYEDLVLDPESTVRELCRRLELAYHSDMLEYGDKVRFETSFVDPKSIYRHTKPTGEYVSAWPQYLNTPTKADAARAYLGLLGKETVERLGYSFDELEEILNGLPRRLFWFRLPWHDLLTGKRRLRFLERTQLAVMHGATGGLLPVLRKLWTHVRLRKG